MLIFYDPMIQSVSSCFFKVEEYSIMQCSISHMKWYHPESFNTSSVLSICGLNLDQLADKSNESEPWTNPPTLGQSLSSEKIIM